MNDCRHNSRGGRVRYRFIQFWPKDGEYTETAPVHLEDRVSYKDNRFANLKAVKRVSWTDKGNHRWSHECEEYHHHYCSRFNLSTPDHYKESNFIRKTDDSAAPHIRRGAEDVHTEYYYLPPMLLPAIHKAKSFDFKAINARKMPAPPIDPFYFSVQSRRRRSARELTMHNDKATESSAV